MTVLRVAASWAEALAAPALAAGDNQTTLNAKSSSSSSSPSLASSDDQSGSAVALALIRRPSLGALFDLWTPLDLLPADARAAAVRMQSATAHNADSSASSASSSSSAASTASSKMATATATAAASRTAAQIEAESFVQQMLAVCLAFPAQTYATI